MFVDCDVDFSQFEIGAELRGLSLRQALQITHLIGRRRSVPERHRLVGIGIDNRDRGAAIGQLAGEKRKELCYGSHDERARSVFRMSSIELFRSWRCAGLGT